MRNKWLENINTRRFWFIKGNIHSKLFNQYISKLLNDYTINYSETCRELGFPKKKSIRWINQKTTDGYSFKSVNEFLEMLNFKDYIEPEE